MGCGQKIFFFLILKQKSQESGENGLVVSFCSDENVQKLWWWLHYGEYSKKHWIVYFKLVNCMECESQWTPGVGDGQGGLACCDSWGHKESDTTEWLIWSDQWIFTIWHLCQLHRNTLFARPVIIWPAFTSFSWKSFNPRAFVKNNK